LLEGIETDYQKQWLQKWADCRLVKGTFIAKPMFTDELIEWLLSRQQTPI